MANNIVLGNVCIMSFCYLEKGDIVVIANIKTNVTVAVLTPV